MTTVKRGASPSSQRPGPSNNGSNWMCSKRVQKIALFLFLVSVPWALFPAYRPTNDLLLSSTSSRSQKPSSNNNVNVDDNTHKEESRALGSTSRNHENGAVKQEATSATFHEPNTPAASFRKHNTNNNNGNVLSSSSIQQWCPQATCHITDLCHPCQRRWLLLIATGRSGSTTLLNMLNALPGVRLAGENNGMLGHMALALDSTRQRPQWRYQGVIKPQGAWGHGRVADAEFACVVQQMAYTLNPPWDYTNGTFSENDATTILGFKTIRYPDDSETLGLSDRVKRSGQQLPLQRRTKRDMQERIRRATPQDAASHQQPQQQPKWSGENADRDRRSNMSPPQRQRQRRRRLQSVATAPHPTHIDNNNTTAIGPVASRAAQFLVESFPCARFVINLRSNVEAHLASLQRLWGRNQDADTLRQSVVRQNQNLRQLGHALGKHAAFVLDSSQWATEGGVAHINDMVSWLGFAKECHFTKAFEYNTKGYSGGEETGRELPQGCDALPV